MTVDRAEAELIRRARGGDGEAFAELLTPEYRAAVRLAKALLHDVDEAEDAVQIAAFKAWRRLGNLRSDSPLRPWFLGIVANQCRSIQRTRWWTSRAEEEIPEDEADAGDAVGSIDLRRAVRRLPYEYRLILVLRYYLDMSFDDVALTLGISPKAARSRVERAINRLRPMLRAAEVAI